VPVDVPKSGSRPAAEAALTPPARHIVLWTVLGSLVPGLGYLRAGRTVLGRVVLITTVALVAGAAVAVPALSAIVPAGTFGARRGLPAAAAAAFLLSAAFFGVDSFITLMLTGVRGVSIAEASLVVTAATVTWSAGSLWQSSRAERISPRRLVLVGACLITAGIGAVAAGLIDAVPIVVPYVGWGFAGVGMGIAFPTIPLSVMREASEGTEAGELSSTLLMDTLGVAVGAGLGGGCIALSRAVGSGLGVGIAGAYGIGLAAAVALFLVIRRLPAASARLDG
jgi:predicted MFS family arabinose efflux permease